MKVEIISKGLFSLIVDEGRKGRQRQGFSQSGPMDEMAYSWANFLAHNHDNTPCLEVIGQMTVCFSEPSIVAITGRQVTVQVNGHVQTSYSSIKINKNDRLTFGSEHVGSKAYLAIYGQWEVPRLVDSACTVVRESLGGLHGDGRAINNKDCISISSCQEQTYADLPSRKLPAPVLHHYEKRYNIKTPLRVVKGYQEAHFSQVAKRMFETTEYAISSSIDRMGYRLTGAGVASSLSSMRSEAIHLGAIQVPPDGQPIIMMRDRQTLGGYPKLGCLNPLDVGRLAQQVPGETVSFVFQDSEEARADMLLSRQHVQRLRGEIA